MLRCAHLLTVREVPDDPPIYVTPRVRNYLPVACFGASLRVVVLKHFFRDDCYNVPLFWRLEWLSM